MNRIVIVSLSFAIVLTSVLIGFTTPAAGARGRRGPVDRQMAVTPTLAEQPTAPTEDYTAELKALQKERIDALSSLVEVLIHQYQAGRGDFRSVAVAVIELVNAKLESTEKPSERVVLLEEQLKVARSVLDFTEAKFRNGMCSQADVYWAKSLYLDIKIKLIRERGKERAD